MIDACTVFICDARMRAVIEGREPGAGGVTDLAILTREHARVEDRVAVTADTGRGGALELPGDVALLAGNIDMRAGEFERG